MPSNERRDPISRRQIVKLMAALGVSGPLALRVAAEARSTISPDALKMATALLDQDFDEARLPVIATALQRNLDQFQVVRDLDIDDLVEPALLFRAEGR
jgi:uncharacterized protein (DUF1501 family)